MNNLKSPLSHREIETESSLQHMCSIYDQQGRIMCALQG